MDRETPATPAPAARNVLVMNVPRLPLAPVIRAVLFSRFSMCSSYLHGEQTFSYIGALTCAAQCLWFCSAGLPPGLRKTCGTSVGSSKIRGSPHKPRGPALQIKKHLIA